MHNKNNGLLLAPTKCESLPEKRQKLEPIDSLSLNPLTNQSSSTSTWERTGLLREIIVHRSRLSNTEVSIAQLRERKLEIDKAFAEEEGFLAIQERVETDTIRHLEARLQSVQSQHDTTFMSTIKSEMSPIRREIPEKLHPLRPETASLQRPTISSTFENPPASSKSEQWMRIKMEQVGNNGSATQESGSSEELDYKKNVPLLGVYANTVEEQLKSANTMIPTLREGGKRKQLLEVSTSMLTKRLEGTGGVEECSVPRNSDESSESNDDDPRATGASRTTPMYNEPHLPRKKNGLGEETKIQSSPFRDHEEAHKTAQRAREDSRTMKRDISSKNIEGCDVQVTKNHSSSNANGQDDLQAHDSSESVPSSPSHANDKNKERSQQNRTVRIYNCKVLVSHPKFLKIDWDKYYGRIQARMFACKKCTELRSDKYCIEDHVWCGHLGGSFQCAYCPDPAYSFMSRRSVVRHMQAFHIKEYSARKAPVNDRLQNHERSKEINRAVTGGSMTTINSKKSVQGNKAASSFNVDNRKKWVENGRVPAGAHDRFQYCILAYTVGGLVPEDQDEEDYL